MALKGALIATILLVFALFGEAVLRLFVSAGAAYRRRHSAADRDRHGVRRAFSGTTTTSEENAEAVGWRRHLGVSARDAAHRRTGCSIGATMLLVADAQGERLRLAVVILVLLGMLLLTFLLLLVATQVHRLLGVTGCTCRGSSVCCSRRSRCSSFSTASARAARRDPGGSDAQPALLAGLVWLAQRSKLPRSGNREDPPWPSCCSSSKPRSRRSGRRRVQSLVQRGALLLLLQFRGAVSARRYKAIMGEAEYQYMAVYEFESEATHQRFRVRAPGGVEAGLRRAFRQGLRARALGVCPGVALSQGRTTSRIP